MRQGGSYVLRFPERRPPHDVSVVVDGMQTCSDSAFLAVQFNGYVRARVYLTNWHDADEAEGFYANDERAIHRRELVPVPNRASVESSTDDCFYQDRLSGLVYMRISGGIPVPNRMDAASDADLYREMTLRIVPDYRPTR
jgi:hypothetical protein